MILYEVVILAWLAGLVKAQRGGFQAVGLYGGDTQGLRFARIGRTRAINEAGGFVGGGGGGDFNPILLQGVQGNPGIRLRLCQRAFQYANGMIAEVLNQQIVKFRVPPIVQCLPQLNGCIQVYNVYVSRYRQPQQVMVYPTPPNRIVLEVQNVDVGVTGNLGGQVTILLRMPLAGIIQANFHRATITVELAIERGPQGPYIRVLTCNARIGYADAYVEQGGMLGDTFNSLLRQRISSRVRRIIPGQICSRLPSIVNERINSQLANLPKAIAASQLFNMLMGALMGGVGGQMPTAQYCQTHCRGNQPNNQASSAAVVASAPAFVYQRNVPARPAPSPQFPRPVYNQRPVNVRGLSRRVYQTNQATVLRRATSPAKPGTHVAAPSQYRAIPYRSGNEQKRMIAPVTRVKRQFAPIYHVTNGNIIPTGMASQNGGGFGPVAAAGGGTFTPRGPRLPPPPPVPGAPPPTLVPPPADLCAKCPVNESQSDSMSFARQLFSSLDMSKLNDLYLSLQLLNTQVTANDFTIDIAGEISPNAQGGTPFGPFPTMFPSYCNNRMADIIVSDYTINSLLYWLHRRQFLSIRIGPETPMIGALLKTTCSEDEDDVEPTAVELDEEARRRRALNNSKTLQTQRAVSIGKGNRGKRQDLGSLADLGICLGDILPAIREKYPKQKLAIQIRTARAPSVILSAAQGGMATLDALLDADLYIDGANNKVGTVTIAITLAVKAQIRGNRLTGSAEITNLKLTDRTQSLGLQQDALDNVANIVKGPGQKLLSDALQKGVTINIPTSSLGGLPINIINPEMRIIEHGLYITTDVAISPSLFGVGVMAKIKR
ncbi:LBP / BPI / CETP family protein [Ancylostoma caninum]|uniref:LBP / BPI / CETP family protein n=1 Tax=Ancylostoma caninum TaxID=29170 RepID=A0A368GMW1_ANCCA|nr:LBP / BPI / CETP family protein [Ancylostoma caninum]